MGLRSLFCGIAALALLAQVPALADTSTCFNPTTLTLREVHFNPDLASQANGAIVEIKISDDLDPQFTQTVRFPDQHGMLRLKDNAVYLPAPITVPNGFATRVRVSVITLPAYASDETLDLIFTGFEELVDALTEMAFKEQPLLSVAANVLGGSLTQEVREQLQDARVAGSGSIQTKFAAAAGLIGPDGGDMFMVPVEKHCSSLVP